MRCIKDQTTALSAVTSIAAGKSAPVFREHKTVFVVLEQLQNVARKYHVMAAKKNGAPFSATTRPTYTKLGSYG